MNDSAAPRCPRCFATTGPDAGCPNCGKMPPQESLLALAPGTLLAGQYRIGRVLGSGGFGITYLALDERLDKRVAIKEFFPRSLAHRRADGATLAPNTSSDRAAFGFGRDGFLGEARMLARFDHPNVVRVRNFFEANGTGYLVMDYYDGDTLTAYLDGRPRGKLPEELAVRILLPVLDGLRAVHASGLLHRDIKPGNIYLTREGRVLLLDFGAARQAIGENSQSLSEVYTDGYAPIEQYSRRGEQGPWTDIYACAATLYRMVTGEAPLDAPGRAVREALVPAGELEPAVSERLSQALQSGLALRAEDRPQSAEAFLRMLGPPKAHRSPPPAPALPPGLGAWQSAGSVPSQPSRRLNRRTWLVAGLASVFVAVFVAGGGLAALAGAWDNGGRQNQDTDSLFVALADSATGPFDPPPLPPDTGSGQPEPPDRPIGVGQYQLMVPQGAAVQWLPNGAVQLQHSQDGGTITAQLVPRYNVAAVPTPDQFASDMANWNTEQPLRPTGQIVSINRYTHLGGFALGRFYEQSYQATDGSSLIHGFFILHVGGRGQGLAIDVFTSGGAQGAQDWDAIDRYAGLLVQSLRTP